MTQLVSIGQAARNALAAYLTTELAPTAGGDGVVCEPRWFEKDRQLPPRAVTIINAGPRQIEWKDPEILSTANNGAAQVDSVWGLGYIVQPLQLDVWALTDVDLDDIIARLDVSLNKGQAPYNAALLPMPVTNNDPFAVGVLIALADGWDPGTVDFTFDAPDGEPSVSEVLEGEWRASYRGVANLMLTQKATTARMARILLQQRLRTTDPVDTTASFDTTTIDANT